MDQLADATPEEEKDMPNWICTFHKWMLAGGRKEATAKAYASQIRILYEDDGKAPHAMATDEYFTLTKASMKNKIGNGQRSAAVRLFVEFFAAHKASGAKLEDASISNLKIYQVKDRATTKEQRQGRIDAFIAEAGESDEAKRLRADLELPADWRVVVHDRPSGALMAAVSPGGRAYTSREAVDERLGRQRGARDQAVPSQPAKRAKKGEAANDSGSKVPATAIAAGTAERAPAAVAPPPAAAVAGKAAPAAAPASALFKAGAGAPVRRTVPLPVAFLEAQAAAGPRPEGYREAIFVYGRPAEKNLGARLRGIYLAEDKLKGGRPVFRKADMLKPTLIFYDEERGLWRATFDIVSKGDFAKVQDKSARPWQAVGPWKVFDGQVKEDGSSSYPEDPELKVVLLDPRRLPERDEVEICLPAVPNDDKQASSSAFGQGEAAKASKGSKAKKDA